MTPEEAEKILEVRIKSRPLLGEHKVYGAVQLGIEALRLNLQMREDYPYPELLILPSETEE
jgi:hypothetical protein